MASPELSYDGKNWVTEQEDQQDTSSRNEVST